jgi:hypothetical protein
MDLKRRLDRLGAPGPGKPAEKAQTLATLREKMA